VVTADPALTFFRADFKVEYALDLRFFRCDEELGPCAPLGTVFVNNGSYQQDARLWVQANSSVQMQAAPAPGYIFSDWSGPYGSVVRGFINSFVMTAPASVTVHFQVARKVQLRTSPPGLQLLIDRTTL